MSNANRPHRRLNLTLPSTDPTTKEANDAVSASSANPSSTIEAAPSQSLISPTLPAQNQAISISAVDSTSITETTEEVETVRVMAYLTAEEAQILDELWLMMRRKHGKVSKSDILRASLTMAFSNQEDISSEISKQQVSTSSRQRSSKLTHKN